MMTTNPPHGVEGHLSREPLLDVTNRLHNESLQHLHEQIKRKSYKAPEVTALMGEGRVDVDKRDAALHRAVAVTPSQGRPQTAVYYHSTPDQAATAAADARKDPIFGHTKQKAFNARSMEGYKTHIGPWQLGKTLGKGSAGMVRLCRHRLTQELAAVKIVSKKSSQLVQAGSIYTLDRMGSKMPDRINGERRIPVAIEREVAILKLIQHPNIMKLYDIWENSKEIYLVLEYVDHGDLFSYITRNGRLSEEGAMHFFRQVMSAISYCHSFNICHRDLKPENILLTSESQVKIADFSMAALHQTSGHRLQTACGSPHYAAPELLSGKKYMGDKADIWSMGIILYAMLAACLPFDDPDLTVMMEGVKRGEYDMPEFLSLEAKDLLRRILQVNPDRRISMKEMWRHPLVQKYDYMDDYQPENKQPTDVRKEFRHRKLSPEEIDTQLVRQLRSLWHMFSEQELRAALMSDEENNQKIFYWLLQKYRERQLENFDPEIVHSRSDYHHMNPSGWKERRTTCEFANTGRGLGKSVSRFTVISRIDETEATGEDSDASMSSKQPSQPRKSHISRARATIHYQQERRDSSSTSRTPKAYRASTGSALASTRVFIKPKRTSNIASIHVTGTTLSSISSRANGQGSPYVRSAGLRRKRGVDFSRVSGYPVNNRDRESTWSRWSLGSSIWDVQGGSVYFDLDVGVPRPDSGVLPVPGSRKSGRVIRKRPLTPSLATLRDRGSVSREELRKFSKGLEKDCDAAFGGTLVSKPSVKSSVMDLDRQSQDLGRCSRDTCRQSRDSTPFSLDFDSPLELSRSSGPDSCEHWCNRPLPPLPPVCEDSPQPVPSCAVELGGRPEIPTKGQARSHLNRLSMSTPASRNGRRVISAPSGPSDEQPPPPLIPNKSEKRSGNKNAKGSQDTGRVMSAPYGRGAPLIDEEKRLSCLKHLDTTVKVVDSPQSPQAIPQIDEQKRLSYLKHLDTTVKAVDSPQSPQAIPQIDEEKRLSCLKHLNTTVKVVDSPQSPQAIPQIGEKKKRHTYLKHLDTTVGISDPPQGPPQAIAPKAGQSPVMSGGNGSEADPPKHKAAASTSSSPGSADGGAGNGTKRRKPSWFKRGSQDNAANSSSAGQAAESSDMVHTRAPGPHVPVTTGSPSRSSSDASNGVRSPARAKRKKFGLLFWRSAKTDTKMSIAGPEYDDSTSLLVRQTPGEATEDGEKSSLSKRTSCVVDESVGQRNIVVHSNWLARIFRAKPVTDHLCFTISRKRARQEITLILRQWRKYGIRDIQIDRQRNIIFARVGARNYLEIKEVAFAIEIMTVIEHGNKEALSIVRFTQERGAASSLHRVVDTMREVFEVRRLLVADRAKAKMMIKTLGS